MKAALTQKDKETVVYILNTFQDYYSEIDVCFLTYKEFISWFSKDKKMEILRFLKDLDITEEVLKRNITLGELNRLSSPLGASEYQKKFVFVTRPISQAFFDLNNKLCLETGFQMWLISGFRSNVYQLLIFLKVLYENNYNVEIASMAAKMPNYSEHGSVIRLAIDVSDSQDAMPTTKFVSTVYPWLRNNAQKFGFTESYPKNAPYMQWEPWHWRYKI